MKARCYSRKSKYYENYGARGIKVCPPWLNNFLTFKSWALRNGYQDNLTIDRINNDGNYEPSNCQWLTKSENSKKARRDRKIERIIKIIKIINVKILKSGGHGLYDNRPPKIKKTPYPPSSIETAPGGGYGLK